MQNKLFFCKIFFFSNCHTICMFKISCLGLVLSCFQRFSFIELARVSLLCLMHEGVEGVVKGIHEVGVMDRGLGACKARGVVSYQSTNKQTNKNKQRNKQTI